uniref:Uncharacterized protein n=1 Tax=Tanacetum cinerariifolium TaxID=118510 RepID=A0A6L2LCL9_TANCI|nr:hypothetical protein [Tanacetum cinerariifolium]
MNQNYFEPIPSYFDFDRPSQYPIDQSPPQKMSIQDMEDLKLQYLEEMKSMINQIQIEDYCNERIDIHYRRECEINIDDLKESNIPLNKINSQDPLSIAITLILSTIEHEDSLNIGEEDLSTIPEKESDEFIKSSVKDFVLIPSESEDTSDSECDLPFCGDEVDEIKLLLHRDPSTPKMSVASILEGFTNEPHLKKNDDLFDFQSKENEWKKILYDAPINDLMTEDKVFDLGI